MRRCRGGNLVKAIGTNNLRAYVDGTDTGGAFLAGRKRAEDRLTFRLVHVGASGLIAVYRRL